jgi:putative SOS response-associated peptidase YedK
MCGRYGRRSDKQRIAEAFHLGKLPPDFILSESYNVAPQTFQPVIRLDRDGSRELVMMKWGLVPYWAKDTKVGYSAINARAENISTVPVFREAFRRRHCLVPADFFYEWQKLDPKGKEKQAWAIGRKDTQPMAFAGLWETWKDNTTGTPLRSFTIITTDPNAVMEPLHDRMPVIVPRDDYDRWLHPDPARPATDLLRPHDPEQMTAWKVSNDVGNVRNDSPELCQPWQGPPTLFS